jgi:hypothetical protein
VGKRKTTDGFLAELGRVAPLALQAYLSLVREHGDEVACRVWAEAMAHSICLSDSVGQDTAEVTAARIERVRLELMSAIAGQGQRRASPGRVAFRRLDHLAWFLRWQEGVSLSRLADAASRRPPTVSEALTRLATDLGVARRPPRRAGRPPRFGRRCS